MKFYTQEYKMQKGIEGLIIGNNKSVIKGIVKRVAGELTKQDKNEYLYIDTFKIPSSLVITTESMWAMKKIKQYISDRENHCISMKQHYDKENKENKNKKYLKHLIELSVPDEYTCNYELSQITSEILKLEFDESILNLLKDNEKCKWWDDKMETEVECLYGYPFGDKLYEPIQMGYDPEINCY